MNGWLKLVAFLGVATVCGSALGADSKDIEFFETRVRPVLAQHCYECHSDGAEKLRSKFSLDSREGLLAGGKRGPAIVPGKPGKSLLIRAINHGDKKLQMPPKEKLTPAQIADLMRWVKRGAVWAPDAIPAGAEDYSAKYEQIRREHWSFQPIQNPQPPEVKDAKWAKSEIDRFVLAELEAQDLAPSAPADRRTLIRRATFDLTGLPPTPEEIDEFVNDTSPQHYEKLLDRLLSSPPFGERWGRHWLDVARYGESTGMTRNIPFYYAWRYRDYVIDAFNQDKPYNRFITEQLAGDLLPAEGDAQRDQQQIATGFLAIGAIDLNERNQNQFTMNMIDEQIDVMGRAVMGLTIACARCHDHKFDPVTTRDYYALAGIFRSSELMAGVTSRQGGREHIDRDKLLKLSGKPIPAPRPSEAVAIQGVLDKGKGPGKRPKTPQQKKQERKRLERMKQLQNSEKEIRPVAMGVRDAASPTDCYVLIRGELRERGPLVQRGFIPLPGMAESSPIPSNQSGRLQLAEWVTHESNPFTGRVIVNRIWQHLFGQGLVRTPDNFGTTGEPPTHPQLLDHLASTFMADGWSVKRAIRRIMLSSAYQQSSAFDSFKYEADPDNRLLWRMSQRRLEGEVIRDAVLAVSGQLDRARPLGSPVLNVPPVDIGRRQQFEGPFGAATSRSVYLPMIRGYNPPMLDVFDMADNTLVTGQRDVTTVPAQALFMMNDPFVIQHSRLMAKRLLKERQGTEAARVERAYLLALGRRPTDAETDRTIAFVREVIETARNGKGAEPEEAWAVFCQALMASAEFRYVN